MRTAIRSSSKMNKNCISFGALSKFKKQIGFLYDVTCATQCLLGLFTVMFVEKITE